MPAIIAACSGSASTFY